MSIAARQRQIYLDLVGRIRPFWRIDPGLPGRIQRVISENRAFGSRDRRLYRELLYTTVRFLPWIEAELESHPEAAAALVAWLAEESPATRDYRAELTGDWPATPEGIHARAEVLGKDPLALLPFWVREECPEALTPPEIDAIHRRGRIWVRMNRAGSDDPGESWELRPVEVFPGAAEARGAGDLTRTPGFLAGDFEIQDLGSQMILGSLGGVVEGQWLDACAGAGGKTLQLATLLGDGGWVDAFDIRKEALAELRLRADRAGSTNVRVLNEPTGGGYDGVLLDVPCSGSGTWRRAPHLKWTTPREVLVRHAERQSALLRRFAEFVRSGGLLVYSTCSLAATENEKVVKKFLEEVPGFDPVGPVQDFGYAQKEGGLAILPARHDTDSFFVATFRKR